MEGLNSRNPLRQIDNAFRAVDPRDESKRVLRAARPSERLLKLYWSKSQLKSTGVEVYRSRIFSDG